MGDKCDIVERLREAHPNSAQRFAGSNILLDAAEAIEARDAEITHLRAELSETEDLRAQATAKCADLTLALTTATAEAMERAAQIAASEGVYPELNIFGGGPEWYRHGQRIAAAIRQAGGESEGR